MASTFESCEAISWLTGLTRISIQLCVGTLNFPVNIKLCSKHPPVTSIYLSLKVLVLYVPLPYNKTDSIVASNILIFMFGMSLLWTLKPLPKGFCKGYMMSMHLGV